MKRVFLLGLLALGGGASATTLTFTGLADDAFEAYISTNDSVEGTLFLAQTSTWLAGAVTGTVNLIPNVTHYLHIRARDIAGPPSMLIGEALLDDANFWFDNTTNQLLTNTVNWKVSLTGFGSNYFTPVDLGGNGTGPWGNTSGIAPTARRIWSTPNGAGGEHYFTARISTVPEPATMAILGTGLAILIRRRKR